LNAISTQESRLLKNETRDLIFISITLLILLGFSCFPANATEFRKTVISNEGTLTLTGTAGPLYYSNTSDDHVISWKVNTTSSNSITYQLLHNGTLLKSEVLDAGESTVLYNVKPTVLPLATHNLTLIATDEIETKFWTILVTVYYNIAFASADMTPWAILITAIFGCSVIMYLSYSQRLRVPVHTST